MDLQQIDKAAKKHMHNGVKDIRLGRFAMAAWSHSACRVTQAVHFKNEDIVEGSVGEYLHKACGFQLKDQDMLHIGLNVPVEGDIHFEIYPEDDVVVASYDDPDGEKEFFLNMTVANFWRFVDTIPNIYRFASQHPVGTRATEDGLYLLSEYANK